VQWQVADKEENKQPGREMQKKSLAANLQPCTPWVRKTQRAGALASALIQITRTGSASTSGYNLKSFSRLRTAPLSIIRRFRSIHHVFLTEF